MTDRPVDPLSEVPEGEPARAPSPGGVQPSPDGTSAAPAAEEAEAGSNVSPDSGEEVTTELQDDAAGADTDTEVDELAAMKGSLVDLTNDLQRLQAEYANYRKRVDRDRQLVAENAAYRALTPVIEVLDTIDRAKEHGELDGGFKAVAEQLERAVATSGLVRFGEPGDAFDPTLHEALSHMGTDPEVEVVTCRHIAKAGYKIGDRVVRAAQVLVVDPVEH